MQSIGPLVGVSAEGDRLRCASCGYLNHTQRTTCKKCHATFSPDTLAAAVQAAHVNKQAMPEEPWYRRTGPLLLLFLFLFPVWAFIVLSNPEFSRLAKVVAWIGLGIIALRIAFYTLVILTA